MTFPSLPPSGFQIISATLLLSLLAGVRSQAQGLDRLNVDTPPGPVGECEATKFTWEGGQAPFTLQIKFQNNNSVFHEFANLIGTAQTWQAAIPAGNVLYLELLDASDNNPSVFSGPFTVIQSGNDTCLPSTTGTGSNTSTVATNSDYPSTGGFTPTSSPVTLPSNPAVADPSSKVSTRALSTGAIAGIAVASLVAGLLIALGVWLIRKRRKATSSPRIPTQRQLDTYHYPQPSRSDGWSVTTPRDPEDELRSQPDEDKTGPSWDPSLFVREKTPSPSPPMDHPVVTRQDIHPGIAATRPLSSYPPLIPTPAPTPMPSRDSGMWGDSTISGASLSRSSTNPFRARMLAAANSEAAQAGVMGSNW